MIKNILRVLFVLFLGSVLFVVSGYYYYNQALKPVSDVEEIIDFEVKDGTLGYEVVENLASVGLIKDSNIMKIYLKLNNQGDFKSGYYKISTASSVSEIVNLLETGSTYNPNAFNITIPEGYTVKHIAKYLETVTNHSKDDYIKLWNDKEYLTTLISEHWFLTDEILQNGIYYPLEGYLFPDTYQLSGVDMPIEEITNVFLGQTANVLEPYKEKELDFTVHEILTLASIVELEGINDTDRYDISTVFYNRLDNYMNLGSDVTTYYGVQKEMADGDLYQSELDDENPYNTRLPHMYGKLPIGPICNPGSISIKATFNPNDNDYFYFVADKHANVFFAKTYNEHLQIIKEIKARGDWIEW